MHYTFIAHCIYSAAQSTVSKVSLSIFLSLQTMHLLVFTASVPWELLQSLYTKELLALQDSFLFGAFFISGSFLMDSTF